MGNALHQDGNDLFTWLYTTYTDRNATVYYDALDAFITDKEMESTRQDIVEALESAKVLQRFGGLAVQLTLDGERMYRRGHLPL